MNTIKWTLSFGIDQEKLIDKLIEQFTATRSILSVIKDSHEERLFYMIEFSNPGVLYEFGFAQGRLTQNEIITNLFG